MWFLLFLLLPLFADASSVVSSTAGPPGPPPPPPVLFNNIMTDYLICARNRDRKTGRFSFEKCARYAETGFHPFCVYMVIPSTETKRGRDFYGCVYAHKLPDSCADRGEYYSNFEQINVRGKEYQGAMMCCMDNYCNQLEEPVFSMVRLKDTSMDDIHSPLYAFIGIITVVLVFYPFVQGSMRKRTDACNERAERPAFLENSIGTKTKIEVKPLYSQQSMKFSSLKKMQDVVRKLLRMQKYSTSTTNHEQEPEREEFKDLQRKDEVFVFQRDAENPRKLDRQIPSRFEHLAQRMVEHGPFFFDFDPVELGDLFDSVAQILAHEPTLLELQPEIDVYGNLEGSYGDLFRWLHNNDWPPKRKVLFLGGLTNNDEPYSLETISLIFALKKLMPKHVYIIRGASEVYPLKLQEKRFSSNINTYLSDVIQRACGYLPLAATVNGVFFSHGGPSPKITSLKKISDLKRPIHHIRSGSIVADLIFSQAGFTNGVIPGSRGWQFTKTFDPVLSIPMMIGAPNKDGTNVTQVVEIDQKVQLFVRSRNCCTDGFMYINRNILSIWSAPGYPSDNNGGCSLSFSFDMEMTINKMGIYGTYDSEMIEKREKQMQRLERQERIRRKSKEHLGRRRKRNTTSASVTTNSESPFKTLESREHAKK